jgi:hypothetical protein
MMKDIDTLESHSAAVLELGRRFNVSDISRTQRDQRLHELRFTSMRRARSRELSLNAPPPVTFYFIEAVSPASAERSLQHA